MLANSQGKPSQNEMNSYKHSACLHEYQGQPEPTAKWNRCRFAWKKLELNVQSVAGHSDLDKATITAAKIDKSTRMTFGLYGNQAVTGLFCMPLIGGVQSQDDGDRLQSVKQYWC